MKKTLTLVALLSSLALSSFASEQTRMQAQMQNRAETMQGQSQAQMQNRAQTMRPQVQAQMQNRTQTRMQENASTTMRSGRPN
jgi:flagellar motor switch protein FliG